MTTRRRHNHDLRCLCPTCSAAREYRLNMLAGFSAIALIMAIMLILFTAKDFLHG